MNQQLDGTEISPEQLVAAIKQNPNIAFINGQDIIIQPQH